MRFLLSVLSCLTLAGGLMAKVYEDPRAVELLASSEAQTSEQAIKRYKMPGEAKQFAPLLRTFAKPVETLGSPSLDLHTPVQIYPNGTIKVELEAKESWMTDDMLYLRGRQVTITSYKTDGSLEAVVKADEIAVDRRSMRAVIRGNLSFTLGNEKLTGNGAIVDLNAQYIRILSKAKIRSSRMQDSGFSLKDVL